MVLAAHPPLMASTALDTRQKALQLNLDPTWYGTFAEIGAGQEVVRWFFQVGAAAGTVAKSMSAYDMTVSDAIYGLSKRYVSRERLEAMLSHEYALDVERLDSRRGEKTCFFAFADTVAARSFKGSSECHGWMGITFQHAPRANPSRIILHVRMLDNDAAAQQEALGKVGVNLVYGAAYLHKDPEALLSSLLDQLSVGRIEIDMIEFSGDVFASVDNRLMSLRLVQMGLSGAAMFGSDGHVLQPSEVFYKKSVLVEPGAFHPFTKAHMDILECAAEKFRQVPDVEAESVVPVMEITMRSLLTDGARVNPQDFLDRVEVIGACGFPVLVSDFSEYYRLAAYLARMTSEPLGVALGVRRLAELFNEQAYVNLPGGILEAFGRLFKNHMKLFVYPSRDAKTGLVTTLDSLKIEGSLGSLFAYLRERGSFVGLDNCKSENLEIYAKDVLASISAGNDAWRAKVPPQAVELITKQKLFTHTS
jgi:hypothetical protein